MEAINVSIKQMPGKNDWQVTVQRRGYSAGTSHNDTYTDSIYALHRILAQDIEEFDGKPVDDRGE